MTDIWFEGRGGCTHPCRGKGTRSDVSTLKVGSVFSLKDQRVERVHPPLPSNRVSRYGYSTMRANPLRDDREHV